MRITRETLIRIAKETALKRSMADKGLVAAYLTGSVLSEDPFLGGATDIDLVLVHEAPAKNPREVLAVTAEVHLDIRHAWRGDYANPKELRRHPRLGYEMYNPMWLYESQHFLEFVQAAVRTRFDEPDNVLGRARHNCVEARQHWLGMQTEPPTGPGGLRQYFETVALAADAVALLHGPPLTERRLLLNFPAGAVEAGRPALASALPALAGAGRMEPDSLEKLLPDWEKDLTSAGSRAGVDVRIAAPRLAYYKSACTALLQSEMPQAMLWPLLIPWVLAAQSLPVGRLGKWLACCEQLGLDEAGMEVRLRELDLVLDDIEELLDGMGTSLGIQPDMGSQFPR